MIRVMLVDDQDMVRAGFRALLEAEDDIAVVGEANDGLKAIELVARAQPAVVLMDVQMPNLDGIEAGRRIVAEHPDVRVIILTTFGEDEYLFGALRFGASGFLLKNAPAEELVAGIRVVANGAALLDPDVTRRVIERFNQVAVADVDQAVVQDLTEREREVLLLLGRGLSNAEIAERLFLGEATVKTYVSNVLSKLHLRDRVQAVIFAYDHGLIRPGDHGD